MSILNTQILVYLSSGNIVKVTFKNQLIDFTFLPE